MTRTVFIADTQTSAVLSPVRCSSLYESLIFDLLSVTFDKNDTLPCFLLGLITCFLTRFAGNASVV